MDIYCVKCRKKTPTVDEVPMVMKNGKHAISGKCAICGTKKFMIIKQTK